MKKKEMFDTIAFFLTKQGAKKISIFGSYVKGKETKTSDVDVLVEFSNDKSLLDLVRIERELSALIKKKVDLLTESALSPYLRNSIKKEALVLYK